MDRINANNHASYPINKAINAYAKNPQVNRPAGAPFASNIAGVRRSTPIEPITTTTPTQRTNPAETVAKIAPSPMAQKAPAIGQLVGAKVQPIDLNNDVAQVQGPKPSVTSAGTYTMYPQAADRIQAATNVAANTGNTGRTLDLRG